MEDQLEKITDAIARVRDAVAAVNNQSDDTVIRAADEAIAAARAAVTAATDVPQADRDRYTQTIRDLSETLAVKKTSRTAARQRTDLEQTAVEQRQAINTAIARVRDAVAAVNNQSDDTVIRAADEAIAAARAAVTAATDVPQADRDRYTQTIRDLSETLAVKKMSRTTASQGTPADNLRQATTAYAGMTHDATTAGTTTGYVINTRLSSDFMNIEMPSIPLTAKVSTGTENQWRDFDGSRGNNAVALRSYKNTKGGKFSSVHTLTEGVLSSPMPANVALTGHTRTTTQTLYTATQDHIDAETASREYPGTYHGVSGEYTCTAASAQDTCTYIYDATEKTTTLGGTSSTWTFTPTRPTDRVTLSSAYLLYGWWMTEADDGKVTIKSFFGLQDSDSATTLAIADGVNTPTTGTATYSGNAIGRYAFIPTPTGGSSATGNFTARATLTAEFDDTTDTIEGTIDQFNLTGTGGLDGSNWRVDLKETSLTDTGTFGSTDAADESPALTGKATEWFIGDATQGATGDYHGQLYHKPTGDTYPLLGIGGFYSEYGSYGRMVGAFGVKCTETECR